MHRHILRFTLVGMIFLALGDFVAFAQTDIEPNNTINLAVDVAIDTDHSASISTPSSGGGKDDSDWHRFVLPSDGEVTISQTHTPTGFGFQFILYGSKNLNSAITGTQTNLPGESSKTISPQAGTYFLQFLGRGETTIRSYTFRIDHVPATAVDEDVEPNHPRENAAPLTSNATHIGHLSFVGEDNLADDSDWYQIDLPSDGKITIHQTHEPDIDGFQYILYGAQNLNSSIQGTETNLPESSSRTVWLEAGRYFLQFLGRGSRVGRAYNVRIEHIPAPSVDDDLGPNDDWDKASPIVLNATRIGHLSYVGESNSPDDSDWYQLDMSADGEVVIHQTHDEPEPGLGFQYILYGAQSLNSSVAGTETQLPLQTSRSVWLQEGRYFLQIRGRGSRIGRVYHLLLEHRVARAVHDDQEPNNLSGNASPLVLNEPRVGHLSFVGETNQADDSDWYEINLPADGEVVIHQSHDEPTLDLGFQYLLYGAQNMNSSIAGTETQLPLQSSRSVWLQQGKYFLQLSGRGARIGRVYELRLEHHIAPHADVDWEPNDTVESASALTLNTSHTGHISFVGEANLADDSDWYRFSLPLDDIITIDLTHDSTDLGFQYLVYAEGNLNSTVFGTETGIPSSTSRSVELTAGDYLLRINGRSERLGRTYVFRIDGTRPTAVIDWRRF